MSVPRHGCSREVCELLANLNHNHQPIHTSTNPPYFSPNPPQPSAHPSTPTTALCTPIHSHYSHLHTCPLTHLPTHPRRYQSPPKPFAHPSTHPFIHPTLPYPSTHPSLQRLSVHIYIMPNEFTYYNSTSF